MQLKANTEMECTYMYIHGDDAHFQVIPFDLHIHISAWK